MSLGQTMITLGMLILLIMTVINANRMLTENVEAQLGSEAVKYSAQFANDLFAEIGNKTFDRAVKGAVSEIDTVLVDPSHYVLDTLWAQDTTGTLVTVASSFSTYQGTYWGVTSKINTTQTRWNYTSHSPDGTLPSISVPDAGSYTDITNTGYRRTSQFKSRTALRDVDDYDGYTRSIRTKDSLNFTMSVKVYYVTSTSPDVQSSSNQFFKQIVVTVLEPHYLSPADTFKALASY